MSEQPTEAGGVHRGHVELVKATCLYVATALGDLMDELVVVGGLVPSLLVDQSGRSGRLEAHAGTKDLDVGLSVSLLIEGRYHALTERLRRAEFSQDVNSQRNPVRQRWSVSPAAEVTIDFLIPPMHPGDRGGTLRNIEADFAAIIAPGLHLAFQDRRRVTLSGRTILGEEAVRDVWVCGPGAYVILKALAFAARGERKDAYDLFYLVRNFGAGVDEVAGCMRPLLEDESAARASAVLRRDFCDPNGIGPRRVAEFLFKGPDEALQADVSGFIALLLRKCG